MSYIHPCETIHSCFDADRYIEVCRDLLTGHKFRMVIHRLGNSISVWSDKTYEWGFIHSTEKGLEQDMAREQLIYVAQQVLKQ